MGQSFMIAITGGSGSGKTTLARALHERLGVARCALMTEDHYYFPRSHYGRAALEMSNEEVERAFDFDSPAAKDMAHLRRDIEALKRGDSVEQPVYDFPRHDRAHGKLHRIEARPVVIVEGIHVLSDASFLPLFDLTVFVDASDDLRLICRIRRDAAERGRSAESVIEQYLRFVRASHARYIEPAKHICDLVVANEGARVYRIAAPHPDAEAIDRLVAPVWVQLEKMGVARQAPGRGTFI
jgi:uridine kinase